MPVSLSRFFDNRRLPEKWIIAKQQDDVLDAIARPSDIESMEPAFIRPVCLVNGAFDILNSGHLRILKEARLRAGTLLVLLDSDTKIKKSKGELRPILTWAERATTLYNTGADIIVEINDDDEFLSVVEAAQPDFRVLGSEYKGKPSRLPNLYTIYVVDRGSHTTDIVKRVLNKYGK